MPPRTKTAVAAPEPPEDEGNFEWSFRDRTILFRRPTMAQNFLLKQALNRWNAASEETEGTAMFEVITRLLDVIDANVVKEEDRNFLVQSILDRSFDIPQITDVYRALAQSLDQGKPVKKAPRIRPAPPHARPQ